MLAGRSDIISAVLRFKSNMDSGMPLAVQLAATAALTVDKEWYSALNEEYEKRKEVAQKIAIELRLPAITPAPSRNVPLG